MFSQLAIALSITKGGKRVIRYWFVRFVGINFFVTIALGACCFLERRGSIAGCGDLANVIGSTLIIFRILNPLPNFWWLAGLGQCPPPRPWLDKGLHGASFGRLRVGLYNDSLGLIHGRILSSYPSHSPQLRD